ncbi:MAG: exodeoxyribonuclease III [Gammaproteobacteria bacterium]|jgi:exodeoxyribonuclease-3|nr:exodeoxyribonuclease III [Gammaproteobacteria bacterium]
MRIITLNANGLRSAARKGFYPWLARQRADVVCLQEIRAGEEQLAGPEHQPRPFRRFLFPAQRPGYAGVAVFSRAEPDRVVHGFGDPVADAEGRYLQLDFPGWSIASVYFPSGSSGEARQAEKFRFLEVFLGHLQALVASGREWLLCGDLNIAHKAIDLKNWRGNQKNSGFLPEERAWLDTVFDAVGFVDVFRRLNDREEQYTWWSNRGRAWDNNVGWRLDYQIATPGLAARATRERIYTRQRFSDHAPLIIDYREPK